MASELALDMRFLQLKSSFTAVTDKKSWQFTEDTEGSILSRRNLIKIAC